MFETTLEDAADGLLVDTETLHLGADTTTALCNASLSGLCDVVCVKTIL